MPEWVRDSGECREWDHWMDGDYCTADGMEVLDRVLVIPSRLFDW